MKKKNIFTLIITSVGFIVAVALLYRYLAPPTQGSGIKVTIPHPVNPNFNTEQLNTLKNDVVDYTVSINVKALIDGSKNQDNKAGINIAGGN